VRSLRGVELYLELGLRYIYARGGWWGGVGIAKRLNTLRMLLAYAQGVCDYIDVVRDKHSREGGGRGRGMIGQFLSTVFGCCLLTAAVVLMWRAVRD